jgi:anti-sigma B factor antagonist
MMMTMTVTGSVRQGVLHLHLRGSDSLDCANAGQVRSAALSHVDGRADVVIDLSEVDFVDSAGVGVLVSVFKAARVHGRSVKFVTSRPGVVSVLRLIKLDQIFDIYTDSPAAVRALRQAPAGV